MIRLVLALLVGAGVLYWTGQRVFLIQTGSMTPTAPVGSLVITGPTMPGVGDIITVQQSGSRPPLTHRVVGMVNGKLQTKGDANQVPDTLLVAPGDVLGRVELIVPYIGYLLAPLWAMPVVAWLLLAIVGLLFRFRVPQPAEPVRTPTQ